MATLTTIEDRMKLYEGAETKRRLMPLLPGIARIDGKCFSTWTRGLARPFDVRLSQTMIETTRWLVEETGATLGYTQSDEITLVFYSDTFKSQIYLDGRIQKMTSILASMATARFNALIPEALPERKDQAAYFDCRVWNVPTLQEAANTVLWRERDATRNSVEMAARALYSHKELHTKNAGQMQEMLFQKGVNWNDYPAFFKRGSYLQRVRVSRPFTSEEIEQLPAQHQARQDPQLTVERTQVQHREMPIFATVVNREQVVCLGAAPQTEGAVV